MRLERLNNLPFNIVTPNFVAIFVLFGTDFLFTERISSLENEANREAILFFIGRSEVNSTEANQHVPKLLFTWLVHTNIYIYLL